MPKNHIAVHRAASIFVQQLQDANIARAEFNHFVPAPGTKFHRDDSQITPAEFRRDIRLTGTATAGDGLNASDNFAETEWLDDEVVGSDFEANQPIKFLCFLTDEDDCNFRRDRSNGSANFITAVAGHYDVQADKVGRLFREQSDGIGAIDGSSDSVAFGLQNFHQSFTREAVIFGDEHFPVVGCLSGPDRRKKKRHNIDAATFF